MRKLIGVAALGFAGLVAAQSPAVVDGNGVPVGFYLSGENDALRVVSVTGYVTRIRWSGGYYEGNSGAAIPFNGSTAMSPRVYFTSSVCAGQGYIRGNGFPPGFLFTLESDLFGTPWYAAKGAQESNIMDVLLVAEKLTNNPSSPDFCRIRTSTGGSSIIVPVQPNDPGVTGFPHTLLPPLRIEVLPFSDIRALFRDSFESTAIDQTPGAIA